MDLLTKYGNKTQALIKLRNRIIELVTNKKIQDAKTSIENLKKILQKWHYPAETMTLLTGLYDDPKYLVKNEKNIREILLRLSFGDYIKKYTPSIMGQEPYQLIMFFKKEADLWYPSKEMNIWSQLKRDVEVSQILGILIIMPSRDLCQKAVAEVLKQAQINPFAAMPVFNWRGTLLYPK